jgi:hypothetical protein
MKKREQDRMLARVRLESAAPNLLKACETALEAFRLTREYVGERTLPAIEGWSWFDATVVLQKAIADAKPLPRSQRQP